MYFIEYEDRQSGKTYTKYFHNRPVVTNAYCPNCRNQVMEQKWIQHPIGEDEVEFHCLHCGANYEEHNPSFLEVNKNAFEPILYLDVYETLDRHVIFEEEKLSSVAKGLTNSKNQKVRITFDEQDMEVPVITPQSRNVRYTPEFLEKAAKAMRDTPLSRQNIMTREDDDSFQSECPACGGMLYEEVNIIFEYCPWCAQKLNKDFSNTKKNWGI